jgi:RNA recognition motif-containing protein
MRTPEQVEVTSARLYVGNLSFDAAESDLTELFSGVGLVQNVEIVMNRHTMRSKGFAFVQMQTIDEAKRAVAELHDKEYMSRKLVVSGAKAVEERRSERTRQPEQ